MVTHWRASGILIALYLDDGFIVIPKLTKNTELDKIEAKKISKHVRVDLIRAGFIYNIAKSVWEPTESIEWLGMGWDTREGTLRVLERRIEKIQKNIREIHETPNLTVRKLHSFVGQIISHGPVCGNISRLMTRHCQVQIAQANDEDESITLVHQTNAEVQFWSQNVSITNVRNVFASRKVNKIICCDASGSGAIVCSYSSQASVRRTSNQKFNMERT